MPFEGKQSWCDHVARERFTLETMGGNGVSFKVMDTQIKPRPASGDVQAAIIAAEKLVPLAHKNVEKITVETYKITQDEGREQVTTIGIPDPERRQIIACLM